jgi:hypothetical protein
MQQVGCRQQPSDILPYLQRPIAERFYSDDEGEPDEYQLYPFTRAYDPGSPICESTFPVLGTTVPTVSAPEPDSRQLACVSKKPTAVWSWKKKGVPWSKLKLLQHTREMMLPLKLAPPPFPLPETLDVLVAGISRLAILKPNKESSSDNASCSRENFPMSRID